MENLNQQQYELIAKHLSGESTPAEEQELALWLNGNPENKQVFAEMKAVWEKARPTKHFAPDVDKAWAKVSARTGINKSAAAAPEAKVVPMFSVRAFMKIAAVVLPLVVLGYLLKLALFSAPVTIKLATAGQKQDFFLPDSTHIWLNQHSTLTYPTDYNNKVREVTLQGEAFFDVKKNSGKPFIVQAQHSQVQVLGTSFLVKTTGNTADEVEVVTGKVSVATTAKGSEAKAILLPGDKAVLQQNGTLEQSKTESPNSLAWKNEQLIFNNTPLPELAAALDNYFEVQVELENPELANCLFTGTFTNPGITEVLQVLSAATGLQYQQQDSTYRLSGQGCPTP